MRIARGKWISWGRIGSLMIWLLMLSCPQPVRAGLVITELMYNPSSGQGGDTTHEYVVLMNNMTLDIDVNGYAMADATNQRTIASNSLVLGEGDFLVVTELEQADFESDFGVSVPASVHYAKINNVFFLSNSGETVRLLDSAGSEIYSATYDDADGGDGNGQALLISNNGSTPSGFTEGAPLSSTTLTSTAVPEPGTFALMALAGGGFFGVSRWRKKRKDA